MQSLTLGLLMLLGAPPVPPATQPVLATSKHYEIRGDTDAAWAAEMGRMLDQAYGQLQKLVGRAPAGDKKLVVNLFRLPQQRDTALGGKLEAGGLFAYDDRQCYLSLQPTNYYTRHLLLHEATHQFVCEAFRRRVDPLPAWFSEGLAEYVAHHNWDGKTLRTGEVDVITVDGNDRLARCKELLRDGRLKLDEIVRSDGADRAPCWALAHVLLSNEAHRRLLQNYIQRALREPDDREPDPVKSAAWFGEVFGKRQARLQKELERFVTDKQRTWREVTVHWQQRGRRILGESDGRYALLAHNRKTDPRGKRIAVTMDSGDWRRTTVGMAVGYRSAHDYHLVELVEGRLLHYVHVTRGLRRNVQVHRLAAPLSGKASVLLSVDCHADHLVVHMPNEPAWRVRLSSSLPAGRTALLVYRGRVGFSGVSWGPVPAAPASQAGVSDVPTGAGDWVAPSSEAWGCPCSKVPMQTPPSFAWRCRAQFSSSVPE